MANIYCEGTVLPFIPLTEVQREALNLSTEDLPFDGDDEELTAAEKLVALWADKYGMKETTGLSWERYDTARPDEYYLYCEYGLNEGGAEVLQEILQGLPEEMFPHLVYEQSVRCDRMRPGEFAGGAIFITREEIRWMTTGEWLRRQRLGVGDLSVEETKVIKDLLRYSWEDINYQYSGLTDREKELLHEETFERLVKWAREGE